MRNEPGLLNRRLWLTSRDLHTSAVASVCHFVMVAVIAMMIVAPSLSATETEFWVVDTVDDLLKGIGDGIAVHPDGRLVPVDPWRQQVELEEPIVLAGAMAADGSLVVGTGHPARLYRIEGDETILLADLEAEQVTALLVEDGGSLLVATIAPGVLYRYDDGEVSEVGRVGEGGFWDLVSFNGTVVAAAGPPATLYRVSHQGLERWAELPDTHARCLTVMGNRLIVGTSGSGLVLSVGRDGGVGLLADSRFTEISDLTTAPDGSIWAAALVGEPEPAPSLKKNSTDSTSTSTTETGTVDLDLPKVNGTTASSELLRLTPDGALLHMHRFTKQVVATVAWSDGGVLVGTGYEGELWRFGDRGGVRLATVDALQVVSIVGGGRFLLTQGPAGIMSQTEDPGRRRYRSDVLKLERPATFGGVQVRPSADGVRIRFRSGLSMKPDPTWLPWTEWLETSSLEVPLPAATSLQWEIEIGQDGPDVERVQVAYHELNLAPVIKTLTVEEAGIVYLSGPPPSGPVIEAEHPDLSGIFTVIGNGSSKPAIKAQGRKYYRVGYRTLSWKVDDPNKDALLFRVDIEDESGFRLPVRERLAATQLAVDTSAVPDGLYRFHLVADDAEHNPGAGLSSEVSSEWIEVDSTPPGIGIEADGAGWAVTVSDAASGVARVDWSRDGKRWVSAAPVDGIFDSRDEDFRIAAEPGRHLLVVRAIDRHHNRNTASVVENP